MQWLKSYTWSFNNQKPITIDGYSRDTSRFCQFTGGGDVLIYGSRHVAFISTGALDDDDDDDDNEMNICAMIKNNVLQLQVNMVLALVHVLREKILFDKISMSELESTTKLSCYGLSFGHLINFELLKLELDFELGT